MPLIRIALSDDTPPARLQAIADGLHLALVEALGVPSNDRFQLVDRYPAGSLIASPDYLGVERRDPVFVQVTLARGRPPEAKAALFAGMAHQLGRAGVRSEDVFVTLLENGREDWSLGHGQQQLLDEAPMRRHGWTPPPAA